MDPLDDNCMYECGDCGLEEPRSETCEARHLFERLDPGGTYTDRECSECGALTYPREET